MGQGEGRRGRKGEGSESVGLLNKRRGGVNSEALWWDGGSYPHSCGERKGWSDVSVKTEPVQSCFLRGTNAHDVLTHLSKRVFLQCLRVSGQLLLQPRPQLVQLRCDVGYSVLILGPLLNEQHAGEGVLTL